MNAAHPTLDATPDPAEVTPATLPYASNRYLHLLDDLRTALSDAGRGK